jgi:hypothetical protein
MNKDTGKIVPMEEVEKMSPEEQKNYVQLTEKDLSIIKNMDEKKRTQWYLDQQKHKQKQIDKRRRHNKLSAKVRMSRKKK